ncbi:hypothetical protein BH11MYX4_BH11MYX4_69880 [soil metagenome]
MDLASVPRETLALLAVAALAGLLLQTLVLASRRWLRRRRMSVRMRRALRGEERAAAWLEELGFAILGAQVEAIHEVRVDERAFAITLRADYLVERAGARYVVEVKTGAVAPKIETSATRRQMLEYRIAFDVDGVLLVDAEAGRVHEVTFPSLHAPEPNRRPWGVLAFVLLAAGAAVAVALLRGP